MKSVGLRVRVEPDLRQAFVEKCRAMDRSASQVLREYMRIFINANDWTVQEDMFVNRNSANTEKQKTSS